MCGKKKEVKIDRLANELISFKEMSTDFMLINKVIECYQSRYTRLDCHRNNQSPNLNGLT